MPILALPSSERISSHDLHHGCPELHEPDLPVAGAEHTELTQGLAILDHLAILLVKSGVGEHLAKLPDLLAHLEPESGDTVGGISAVILGHRKVPCSLSGKKGSIRVDRILGLFHVESSFAQGPGIL